MNDNKLFIAVSALAVAVLVCVGAALYVGRPDVNVTMNGQPVSVTNDGKPVTVSVPGQPVAVSGDAPSGEQTFGSSAGDTTNWTAGAFSSDLAVGGTLTVNAITATGTITQSGAVALSGTTTITGTAIGVSRLQTISMTNGTNTVCAVQNTSGNTRIVTGAYAKITSSATNAATLGIFAAGTSTGPTVTSTSPWISTQITRSATLDVLTPTSTFASSTAGSVTANYQTWRNLEWVTFNQGSTSVAAGTCYIDYTQ